MNCLTRDREALFAFYHFPAEHWQHIRTTNPIESVFATAWHRTVLSKGCLSHPTALALVFKLAWPPAKAGARLNGYEPLPRVIEGVQSPAASKPPKHNPRRRLAMSSPTFHQGSG